MNEKGYPVVSSPRDLRFLNLRSLQTHQGRSRTKLFIIESVRHLTCAGERCARIKSVVLDASVLSNPFGQKLALRLRQQAIPGIRLSRELYRDLTLATELQGTGAVLRKRWSRLEELRVARNSLWLTVESIESPGNLARFIRTAEAAGVDGVFILNPKCDPHDPAAIRATMGSLFSQTLVRCSLLNSVAGRNPTGSRWLLLRHLG
ncbi:MAG: hypothetical protein JST28_19855 [Acidobacteria bacterium]|nr:hypothetical protein [Acidobacteriota bacterium]